jgi:hypothetical protein
LREFQRWIALRLKREALRRGSFQFVWARDGVVAVSRQLGSDTVIALFNASRDNRRLDLPLADLVRDDTVFVECFSSSTVKVEAGMLGGLRLSPRSVRVFATTA